MKTIIYKTPTEKIIYEWNTLWDKSNFATVVNSSAWFLSATNTYAQKDKKIVAVYSRENLVAVAGFVKNRMFGLNIWTTPGMEFADRQSLLFDAKNRRVTRFFLNEIRKLGKVYLCGLTEDNVRLLKRELPNSKFMQIDEDPYALLSENPYGDFPRRHRTNILNRLTHLEQPVAMETSRNDHTRTLSEAFAIELESSKMQHGKSVFDRNDAKSFYSTFAKLSPKNIAVSILYFGVRPAAYCIGFTCNNTFFASQKAHLLEYNYYNPGKALMIKLLEYWNGEGLSEFSHGRGVDRFKLTFTKTSRPIFIMTNSHFGLSCRFIYYMILSQKKIYTIISSFPKIYSQYHNLKKLLGVK